ncbi:protein SPMIP7-like [Tubulanus polymorphus]|uniref:protein SPMIP7-like n=1 Tax=Tubulanus polymorphus TaxID=672921 RepID=UPI003DA46358
MTEVIAPGPVLSDSTFRTRPDCKIYFLTDTNSGGNAMQQIESNRQRRHMKFPTLSGKRDVDSFQHAKTSTPAFKKFNDDGDHRVPAPFRSFDNIVDPVSGFVSIGGDVDRDTGVRRIKSLVQLNRTPQNVVPREIHSIRKSMPSAPPETNREREWDPPAPYLWNSRAVSDEAIRAALGGWTSKVDPRKVEEQKLRGARSRFEPKTSDELARDKRDRLALKYVYTSSTQRAYEEIPWDGMLHPRKWPYTHTLEDKPDMISQRWRNKRYDSAAKDWQLAGKEWDQYQTREGHYENRPVTFCEPLVRAQQIPGYSGFIGSNDKDAIDNATERFQPHTVKRNEQPKYCETGHRPHIPGFAGCTLYRSNTMPVSSMTHPAPPFQPVTGTIYKSLPAVMNNKEHHREGKMSKMVTLVPPCNPFNKIEKEEVLVN